MVENHWISRTREAYLGVDLCAILIVSEPSTVVERPLSLNHVSVFLLLSLLGADLYLVSCGLDTHCFKVLGIILLNHSSVRKWMYLYS